MKLLLDTHVILWAAIEPEKLSKKAVTLLEDPDSELLFSAVNFWEIAIKRAIGRADFVVEPRVLRRSLLDNGYSELAVSVDHALAVEQLPTIHADPFDRMLIAQALHEGITLLTADQRVAQYPGPIQKI